jgi:spermidine/putrescine transport system substrate-binding protein
VPLAPRRALAAPEDHATSFTWGGFDIPDCFGDYVAKHGELPNFATFGSAEEAFTKLNSGFVADIAHPCLSDVPRWSSTGLFQLVVGPALCGAAVQSGGGGDVWWCAAIKAGVPFDQIHTDDAFEKIAAVLREQRPLIRSCSDDIPQQIRPLLQVSLWRQGPVNNQFWCCKPKACR